MKREKDAIRAAETTTDIYLTSRHSVPPVCLVILLYSMLYCNGDEHKQTVIGVSECPITNTCTYLSRATTDIKCRTHLTMEMSCD